MIPYLLSFVLSTWPSLVAHRLYEVSAILADIAGTDATPIEALELANIAAYESTFRIHALGDRGRSRGPFQVMAPSASYGAREALRRLRIQGIMGFIGCANHIDSSKCIQMAENRTAKAILWLSLIHI